ncbi:MULTISPECIES: hypothetical protein [unclassified Streptomyces]|uniref:hypothetical protein n=1 Tax=unclassified Streptomyces TaxID=2593676 RepID=UPI0035E3351E
MSLERSYSSPVPAFTRPGSPRLALETALGPLDRAAGPVLACACCGAASRDAECVTWREQMSGSGWSH